MEPFGYGHRAKNGEWGFAAQSVLRVMSMFLRLIRRGDGVDGTTVTLESYLAAKLVREQVTLFLAHQSDACIADA